MKPTCRLSRPFYSATKEAIRVIARVAAKEWGKYNINVNAICPASMTPAIESWMKIAPDTFKASLAHMPSGRYGDPENDSAPVVLALGSSVSTTSLARP